MYKFNKKSWHVKFFKWIFNSDPTTQFKTMCPYFWTYILIFALFPLILVFKIFGSYGSKILNKIRTYESSRTQKLKTELIQRCSEELTDEECYLISESRCYKKYGYILSNENYYKIISGRRRVSMYKYEKNKQDRLNKKARYTEIKESKLFTFISYLILLAFLLSIIFTIMKLYSYMLLANINWNKILIISGWILAIILIAILLYYIVQFIIEYIITPLIDKISCFECKFCKKISILKVISKPIILIYNGFMLIIDMVVATYKKHCPLIIWEDDEKLN